jgi:uncharacterized protein (UPF0548 family)
VSISTRAGVRVGASIKALFAVSLLALLGLSACDVGCEPVCRKVLDCDGLETTELTLGECTAECVRQSQSFEIEEDEAGAVSFAEHKRCLKGASCDEISDGICYDADLFSF